MAFNSTCCYDSASGTRLVREIPLIVSAFNDKGLVKSLESIARRTFSRCINRQSLLIRLDRFPSNIQHTLITITHGNLSASKG
jgi:hypothetical protein